MTRRDLPATVAPMSPSLAGPPASFSPSSGPAFIVVDGTSELLKTVAGAAESVSVIGSKPSRVLEGNFGDDRALGLFRAADLNAANTVLESLRAPMNGFHDAGRLCVGHHALGDDAPDPADERDLAYLVVHGFISNREVYGAYLRGLKESGLLTTNGCERLLMMGPSNVRTVATGPLVAGEYFEVLSFPSRASIEAFWLSDAYAKLIDVRRGAVDVFAAIFGPG